MLQRELINVANGELRRISFCLRTNMLIVDDTGRQCRKVKSTDDFYKEVRKWERKKFEETAASQSRVALIFKQKKNTAKFWTISIDGNSLITNYGEVPSFGWYGTGGTTRTTDFDTQDEAHFEFSKRIRSKLSQGYKNCEPRDNEYHILIAAPPSRPAKAKATTKTKKSTGKSTAKIATPSAASPTSSEPNLDDGMLRFELVDGKSSKFWQVQQTENQHTVNYGRIGTKGQQKSKEFADSETARNDAGKLIAQKVKKGYQFVSAGGNLVDVERVAESDSQIEDTPETRAAETEDLEITSVIDLQPLDEYRATFRKLKPLKPGTAEPFDYDACRAKFRQLKRVNYSLPVHKLNLQLPMSSEEAMYWYTLLSRNLNQDSKAAGQVDARQLSGKLRISQVKKDLTHFSDSIIAVPLYQLLGHDDFVKLMLAPLPKSQYGYDVREPILAIGFASYLVPWIPEKRRAEIRKLVKDRWEAGLTMPANHYQCFPAEVYLAAGLGMHRLVAEVIEDLPDDHYGGNRSDGWNDHYQRPQDLVLGLGSEEDIVHHWQRLRLRLRGERQVRGFLACTRLNALDIAAEAICRESNKDDAAELVSAFGLVRAPEVAEPMLYCVRNSRAPAVARAWLDRHRGNAIAGLASAATGRGKLAEAAIQYLLDAKRDGHLKLIKAACDQLDQDEKAKLKRTVIDFTEKQYRPFSAKTTPGWLKDALSEASSIKAKSRPAWADPGHLPALTVGENKLNDDQTELVLRALQANILPKTHLLLTAVREHIDPGARDAFAWRLFERWSEDGSNTKQKWAMCSIGHLGADKCAADLTPLIRIWPGENQHPRAVLGLECLRGIGSDFALMQLNGISQKLKFQGLKKKAREFMEAIASQRGMSRSELEDLIVPDLDLDRNGTRTFDFGTRSFQFLLKPDLKPAVKDESGKIRADLPKPAAKDDREKADPAIADWKILKKSLREAIKIQVPRLEQAMVTGRRWSLKQFEQLLVQHPLMINFVRMLLWGSYDAKGKLNATFRVTEEQDYADINDETCQIPLSASVSIVHPLHLKEKEIAGWSEVFSDYEIAAPFAQLGRPIYNLESGEQKKKDLVRFRDLRIPPTTLVGTLDRLGWARGIPEDGGAFHEHSKPFYGADVTAILGYEDGIPIGYMEGWDDQNLTECIFLPGIYTPQMYPDHNKLLPLGKVDEVVISEVLSDLHVLASRATK